MTIPRDAVVGRDVLATGTVNGAYLQATATVTEGNRCSDNTNNAPDAASLAMSGRQAKDANGLILSCQYGRWHGGISNVACGVIGTTRSVGCSGSPNGKSGYWTQSCGADGSWHTMLYTCNDNGWWGTGNVPPGL